MPNFPALSFSSGFFTLHLCIFILSAGRLGYSLLWIAVDVRAAPLFSSGLVHAENDVADLQSDLTVIEYILELILETVT